MGKKEISALRVDRYFRLVFKTLSSVRASLGDALTGQGTGTEILAAILLGDVWHQLVACKLTCIFLSYFLVREKSDSWRQCLTISFTTCMYFVAIIVEESRRSGLNLI